MSMVVVAASRSAQARAGAKIRDVGLGEVLPVPPSSMLREMTRRACSERMRDSAMADVLHDKDTRKKAGKRFVSGCANNTGPSPPAAYPCKDLPVPGMATVPASVPTTAPTASPTPVFGPCTVGGRSRTKKRRLVDARNKFGGMQKEVG